MLENITVAQAVALIGMLYAAIKFIDSAYDLYKKHSVKDALHKDLEECKQELNKELDTCKQKLDFHSQLLDKDKRHFEKVDEDLDKMKSDFIDMQKQADKQFSVMVKTLLALVSYSLDNTNKDDLKDAQKELLSYLSEK